MAQVLIRNDELKNIQADILIGMPKKTQYFFFFSINEDKLANFKTQLGKLIDRITTSEGAQHDRHSIMAHKKSGAEGLVPLAEINIAFSHTGLETLGFNKTADDKIGDDIFDKGMQSDIAHLGDRKKDWRPEFVSADDNISATHGIILVAGDSHESIQQGLDGVKEVLGDTVREVDTIRGDVRPGPLSGHEHFGYKDGISQPHVVGLDNRLPGQDEVPQGVILLGRDGDPGKSTRPEWAIDGSFLCFRMLAQRVPEFDAFLTANALPVTDQTLPADNGKELFGARMVGRWKSGAPIDVPSASARDDPDLARDEDRNNVFRFEGDTDPPKRCPFAAHIRKTNPRADLDPFGGTTAKRILRRGIPFGVDVAPGEKASNTDEPKRGLLFVCYQSVLDNGFRFIQKSWANEKNFMFGKDPKPGFDPIIGQNADDTPRETAGLNPANATENTNLGKEEWVVSKGGEYYFSPSIKGLKRFAGII